MGLSRRELYARIGLLREIDPLTEAAYNFVTAKERLKPRTGHAHKTPWHVSFHGSQFPGSDKHACGRRAIYTMMDLPREEPWRGTRWLEQVADAGKDIEDQIVKRWWLSGYLLSNPPRPYSKVQTQFEDAEHWLTSTVDAIVLWPKRDQGIVCEVKSKDSDVIEDMLKLCRGPDPKHVMQLKTQIGMAHEAGPQTHLRCINTGRLAIHFPEWILAAFLEELRQEDKILPADFLICPEHGHTKCLEEVVIQPPDYGYIYYVSRNRPSDTWEFYYDLDEEHMRLGRERLKRWQEWFKRGQLPQTQFEDKRFSHPFGWTWGDSKKMPDSPCKWCDFGQICREDHRAAIKKGEPLLLSESCGIQDAGEIREDYDLDLVRAAIEARWPESDSGATSRTLEPA